MTEHADAASDDKLLTVRVVT